jgi:hypothetical protein
VRAFLLLDRDGRPAATVWADSVAQHGAVVIFFFGPHMLALSPWGYREMPPDATGATA